MGLVSNVCPVFLRQRDKLSHINNTREGISAPLILDLEDGRMQRWHVAEASQHMAIRSTWGWRGIEAEVDINLGQDIAPQLSSLRTYFSQPGTSQNVRKQCHQLATDFQHTVPVKEQASKL